jgi:hypothetical protein
MKIETHTTLSMTLASDAWELYERVFTPVNELAAQRHLMYRAEFQAVCEDTRVTKYLAFTDDGTLCGMSVITNDLDAWPLISPAFFARRFPEHYRDRRIFYVGFVGVGTYPPASAHVFSALIFEMQPQVADVDGIAVMDFCAHNVDNRNLPVISGVVQQRSGLAMSAECTDRQEFWAYRYGA